MPTLVVYHTSQNQQFVSYDKAVSLDDITYQKNVEKKSLKLHTIQFHFSKTGL